MKIKLKGVTALLQLLALLTGCASTQLKAPCPNFGAHCYKIPINNWDYRNT